MMDPAAGLTAMFGPYAPAADGSSATKMAASLRTFLAADFDTAVSGHSTVVPISFAHVCLSHGNFGR